MYYLLTYTKSQYFYRLLLGIATLFFGYKILPITEVAGNSLVGLLVAISCFFLFHLFCIDIIEFYTRKYIGSLMYSMKSIMVNNKGNLSSNYSHLVKRLYMLFILTTPIIFYLCFIISGSLTLLIISLMKINTSLTIYLNLFFLIISAYIVGTTLENICTQYLFIKNWDTTVKKLINTIDHKKETQQN